MIPPRKPMIQVSWASSRVKLVPHSATYKCAGLKDVRTFFLTPSESTEKLVESMRQVLEGRVVENSDVAA